MRKEWPVPLTGVAFIALLIAGFIVMGEPPSVEEEGAEEIVDFYVENDVQVFVGSALIALAGLSMIFFGAYLRKVLSAAEGEGGMLSAVVLVGAAVIAVGAAIDATISVAIAASAEDIEPTATQALQALWDHDFLPIFLGIFTFLLAAGISIARHAALAAWLGWTAIALVVLYVVAAASEFDPVWVVASLGSALWVVVISVLLAVRARRATA